MTHFSDRRGFGTKFDITPVIIIGILYPILLAAVTYTLEFPQVATLTGYIFGVMAMRAVVRISQAVNGGN